MIAAAMALDLDLESVKQVAADEVCDGHVERFFGPVGKMSRRLRGGLLDKVFGNDDNEELLLSSPPLSSLHVVVTDPVSMDPVVLSNFENREDLVDALMASCFIPVSRRREGR